MLQTKNTTSSIRKIRTLPTQLKPGKLYEIILPSKENHLCHQIKSPNVFLTSKEGILDETVGVEPIPKYLLFLRAEEKNAGMIPYKNYCFTDGNKEFHIGKDLLEDTFWTGVPVKVYLCTTL